MFQFPAFAPSLDGLQSSTAGVPPFGHLRINSCLQIPGAFRSLPRPSSLSEAKASSVRSCSLSLCESLCDFKSQSVFTRLPYEIVALNIRKFRILSDYFFHLPRYLSQYFQRSNIHTHSSARCITKKTVKKVQG